MLFEMTWQVLKDAFLIEIRDCSLHLQGHRIDYYYGGENIGCYREKNELREGIIK